MMTEEESLFTTMPPITCRLCGGDVEDDSIMTLEINEYEEQYYVYFHPICYTELHPVEQSE